MVVRLCELRIMVAESEVVNRSLQISERPEDECKNARYDGTKHAVK